MMDAWGIALAFALTCVPAFLIAHSLAISARRREPGDAEAGVQLRLAMLLRFVGIALVAGAAAMLWAAGVPARIVGVALAIALVVNGLALAMLVTVLRGRRPGPPP